MQCHCNATPKTTQHSHRTVFLPTQKEPTHAQLQEQPERTASLRHDKRRPRFDLVSCTVAMPFWYCTERNETKSNQTKRNETKEDKTKQIKTTRTYQTKRHNEFVPFLSWRTFLCHSKCRVRAYEWMRVFSVVRRTPSSQWWYSERTITTSGASVLFGPSSLESSGKDVRYVSLFMSLSLSTQTWGLCGEQTKRNAKCLERRCLTC